jgi:hypothetical protein
VRQFRRTGTPLTSTDAEREIGAFIERYNRERPVERHDHCTPRAIRAKLQAA